MRRTLPLLLLAFLTLAATVVVGEHMQGGAPGGQSAQGGDQILDGIGETSLIARYVFNGNVEDASRNQLHARLVGTGAAFVDDGSRRVLLLTGDGSHVQLPASALAGEDAIAVVGWLYLPTRATGPVFDFGSGASTRLSAVVDAQGFRASVLIGGQVRGETPAKSVVENQWTQFAVVLDPAAKVLTAYVDGARAGQATNVDATPAQIVPQASATNRLFLGRAQDDSAPTLHARLRDVRLYRVALGDEPVAAIRRNALASPQAAAGRGRGGRGAAPEISTANIPRDSPFAPRLVKVADVTVETTVGMMPRLPAFAAATFAGGATGEVRVIWPAPTDNSSVLKPGTYDVTGRVPGTVIEPKATVVVKAPVRTTTPPERLVEAFPLTQVSLDQDAQGRDTPFIRNRDKFLSGLAASNPDSFLYNFREAFGQPQPEGVKPLGGWDSQTTRLRGHATGHYLTAIAQAYASTGYDPAVQATFLKKMNYLVDALYDLSQKSGKPAQPGGASNADPVAVPIGPGRQSYDSNLRAGAIRTDYWNWGVGFISAYPPDQFIMLERGATYGTQDSQIWAPYYTLHKILAGLLDTYEVAGNKKALEIARGMGAWVHARLAAVPAETRVRMWSRYIAGEYGGMNEAMARLFRLTGERKFLDTAKLFDNTNFFYGNAAHEHGLAKGVDTVRGRHANQHIPQITGALETFRNTRELPYYQIATNFWQIVNDGYMYSIGGVAGARNPNNAECFPSQPSSLWENGLATGGQNETCATYNLLKLDRQLFMYEQTAKYMDHYERALYNHILASVAEQDAGNTYHVPLNPGARKQFGNAGMNGFTCCNGTALESNTKLQDTIYFHSANHQALYVNLFVPSTLTWTERKVTVQQVTDFPYADTTRLVIKGSGRFDVNLRVPDWATRGMVVKINGRDEAVKATPGTYLELSRTWRDNDTIEVKMPFTFHLDHLMDQPNVASLFYGPILLAAEESAARTDYRQVVLDVNDISKSITGDPATLQFQIGDASFRPFYQTYGRHSVYLHVTFK
ncbi:MAG TPA: beta-L-arabinofuranosidase domain-containing protein [Vicinamibacterales bacterium]|nr:beta-L-arabinofuranosidase domain-containing protein [Vicinamibacterales bacterium]